jgi:hypothetical protein
MGAPADDAIASPAARLASAIDLDPGHAGVARFPIAGLGRLALFAAMLAGYAALTALFFWQVLPHLSSALLGPPEDNFQDFWNSWYAAKGHQGAFFFTNLIRAPEGVSLYYHSFAYPQVFAVWGLSRIFGTSLPMLILLQNLTNLASFPLAATGAFYLCRYLRAGLLGAAAGGFIFAFNPWHIAQAMHHAHVAGIEFLPCFVLCYLQALKRESYRWLAAAVLFYALSALSCWYYLFYGLYFLAFHILYLRVHRQAWPRGWNLSAPALCLAGVGILLSPLILPMIMSGFSSSAYQPGGNIFVADLLGYAAFPPTHPLSFLSKDLFDKFTGNSWEVTAYLGFANLVLLAWGFWQARDGERPVLWYALGGMIFFAVLASGDALHWLGRTLPIHMPDIVLSKLPFFANVRTPGRAMVLVYLFLGVGVAMAVTAARKRPQSLFAGFALSATLLLVLLDFFPVRLETADFRCAPELAVLNQDRARNFAVLDLPFGYSEDNFYMAQQACHGRPIAQGVVARQLAPTLADHLEIKDMAAQSRQLRAAGIKYVILHRPRDGLFAWNKAFEGDFAAYFRTYTMVSASRELTILKVY